MVGTPSWSSGVILFTGGVTAGCYGSPRPYLKLRQNLLQSSLSQGCAMLASRSVNQLMRRAGTRLPQGEGL